MIVILNFGSQFTHLIARRVRDLHVRSEILPDKIPPELLEKISSKITGSVRGVNRVLYDITQKPPATIEYE